MFIAGYEIGNRGGLYAEYAAVPEQAALPLPAGVGADEATTLTNYQLAIILLHHAARGVDAEDRGGLWRGRRRRLGADRRRAARRRERDRHRGLGGEMRLRARARRRARDRLPHARPWSSACWR